MRIWSVHPQYLDSKGLVACWRETLLAKHVLLGKTKGYKNHPQLNRFKATKNPVLAIDSYLKSLWDEATHREYKFDLKKIGKKTKASQMKVNSKQLAYEFEHLLKKLKVRDKAQYLKYKELKKIIPHPLFKVVKGEVEDWEIV